MIPVELSKRAKKLKDGSTSRYWTLRWRGTDGTRYSESIGKIGEITANAAESRRREKEAQINTGLTPRDKPQEITLKDFIEHDLEACSFDLKKDTLQGMRHAGQHAREALGDEFLLSRVNDRSITQLKRYVIEQKGCSVATLSKTLRTLKAMFNRAVKYGFLHSNPFARVQMAKTQSRAKRVFSQEEIDALIEAASTTWWKAFIALAATSGFRKSELLNLMWRDIDFDRASATVAAKRRGKFSVPGRGDFPIFEWTAKSYETRTVPLPPAVIKRLLELQEQSDGSAYLFLTLDRLEQIQDALAEKPDRANYELVNDLRVRFLRLQDLAKQIIAERRGVEVEKVSWITGSLHDFRRTYGTHMARHVPIHVLKEYMGHSKIATTQEFYLAVDSRDADTARTVLDSLVGGGASTPSDGRTLDAPGDSEQDQPESKNDKALQMQGLSSEADGTRTRNHRIDSPVL